MQKVLLIKAKRFGDSRGWFSETYNVARFAGFGLNEVFVQDNHSYSKPIGTLRGIHFQTPPHAQAKLVRCIRGRILDVAVDLRQGSPTYGRWVSAELSAENGDQLFVPVGFGHAFVTLEPDSEVTYKVTSLYAPSHDGGIRWSDPDIGVDWPLPPGGAVLSDKDTALPFLRDFDSPFAYDGTPLTLETV
ncbi:dTDP-4-dehydrorhamnose 3,5-epimerase [Zavarzinia aquatilis]|uniref:dTDP-4-dehydrorhamnose 3,5-epimerase n=2 Tax=Zavarzinia aquatilis TaxID=2211142 RepID=A0A317EI09_9PROT|nr:dTDP-4-dehydrorhamnose 3,5-epimerase [Zavarzinia aquatilis]PWR25964.1 dTDP-4-dehydrorhamnose 3,5-epimerase [Zavarzinia aquatilis]